MLRKFRCIVTLSSVAHSGYSFSVWKAVLVIRREPALVLSGLYILSANFVQIGRKRNDESRNLAGLENGKLPLDKMNAT